jgi:hypothetical protein
MRSPAHAWIICADCYESYSLCRHTVTQNGDYNANGEVSARKAAHSARCRPPPSGCSRCTSVIWRTASAAFGVEAEGLIGAAGAD